MKTGMTKGSKPIVKKGTGKAVMHILGVGLAAGLALIAATDKGMKKFTGYEEPTVSEEADEE